MFAPKTDMTVVVINIIIQIRIEIDIMIDFVILFFPLTLHETINKINNYPLIIFFKKITKKGFQYKNLQQGKLI